MGLWCRIKVSGWTSLSFRREIADHLKRSQFPICVTTSNLVVLWQRVYT